MTALEEVRRQERETELAPKEKAEKGASVGARSQSDSIGRGQTVFLRLIGPIVVLAAWWIAALSVTGPQSVLPAPPLVLAALVELMRTGQLFVDLGASLGRAFAGFIVAGVIGITVGLLMSQSRIARGLLAGPVELLRPISSIAWIPLAILWFGLGFKSVVFVIVISCVFIILLNTIGAATRVDADLVKAALTLGADRRMIFTKVVLPNAVPGIMLGLRIAMTGAWGGVLIAEMIATHNGLGYLMARAQASFHPDVVIGVMLVVGLVGFLLNMLFLQVQKRVTHV